MSPAGVVSLWVMRQGALLVSRWQGREAILRRDPREDQWPGSGLRRRAGTGGKRDKKNAISPRASSWRFPPQQTRDVQPMLVQCWTSVEDDGPTLYQHWLNVSCLLGRDAEAAAAAAGSIILKLTKSHLHSLNVVFFSDICHLQKNGK